VSAWSGAGVVSDVQAWVNTPSANFGWVMVGPETTAQRVRKFYSSEAAQFRPRLTVTVFAPDVSAADAWALCGTVVSVGAAGAMAARKVRRRRDA